jgi:hypothetical protein
MGKIRKMVAGSSMNRCVIIAEDIALQSKREAPPLVLAGK